MRARDRGARDRRPDRAADLRDEGPAAVSDDKTTDASRPSSSRPRTSRPPTGEVRQVGDAAGMFGVHGTGDTSGYGGLSQPVVCPGAAQRPYGGWFDEVADALESRPDVGLESRPPRVVIHRGEITFHVRREDLPVVAQCCATTAACASSSAPASAACTTRATPARELHAVYHLLSMTHNRRIRLEVTAPDADPHIPSHRRRLPDRRLARARDLGHVRHHLRRPPRADPDPDARRLAGSPAAQGLPAGRHPGRVQGRDIPPPDERRCYN